MPLSLFCLSIALCIRILFPVDCSFCGFVLFKFPPHISRYNIGMGCTHFLPLIAGYENANRMLLTGEIVNGDEALKLGVVGDVKGEVADDCHACVESAIARATLIANQGPIAVQSNLLSLRRKMDEGLRRTLSREASAQALCYATSDFAEGLDAIKTKRRPEFGGM